MRIGKSSLFVIALLTFVQDVRADGVLSFFGGANIGGDLSVLTDGNVDLATSIKNSPVFGLRVGSYSFPVGFEGSLTYSPSALIGGVDDELDVETNILYAEANLLFIVLPGPVSPFVTGGLGVHYLDFDLIDLASTSQTKFGWNVGGGVKVNVQRLQFRVDVRDHVTTLSLGGILGGFVGLGDDARVHNVELSFGVGIRF